MFIPLTKLELKDIKFKHGRISPRLVKSHHQAKQDILNASNALFQYLNTNAAMVKKKADEFAISDYTHIENTYSSQYAV